MTDVFMGRSVPRLEDHRFLTGTAVYADDLNVARQAWGVVVRSLHAHAEIKSIDASAAREMPGVIAVYTEADLAADGVGHLLRCGVAARSRLYVPPRPALARDRVRYVGDQVAFVVAETQEAAAEAAEQIFVDYGSLPAVVDGYTALEEGAASMGRCSRKWIFASRKVIRRQRTRPSRRVHVVELDIVNNKISAAPMEPRSGIGEYDASTETYKLTCSAQGLHGIRGRWQGDPEGAGREA